MTVPEIWRSMWTGTAKAQTKISDPRPGNGKQILFSKFDSNWITEVRNIKE